MTPAALGAGLLISAPQPAQPAFDPDFASVLRGPDRTPDAAGQWGAALRYLAEDLNHTEFGLYFINYHSRLPTVGARTATPQDLQGGYCGGGRGERATSRTTFGALRSAAAGHAAGHRGGVQQASPRSAAGAMRPPAAAPGEDRQQGRVGEQRSAESIAARWRSTATGRAATTSSNTPRTSSSSV